MDRYNDQASGRALIEIRLCNERATPMPIPIGLWMFQTKLHVNAGGADVFLPVCDVLEQDLAERDEEVRQLNLQYRNRLEYAIGRTCSAAWSVNGSRRPSAVWTTWLPVAETPHTRPGRWRTRCCPWTVAEGLRSGLASFVAGYGSWFQGQAAVAAELPEHLHPTADERLAHVAAEKEALRCFQFMNQVMRDHRKSLSEVQ